MLKAILLIAAVGVVILLVVIATRPDTFTVTRSAVLAAPPAAIFAQVNNFRRWEAWSPWARLDPQSKATFDGPESGAGATFHWSGNAEVGEGTQRIVESQPDELVRIRIDFVKPFQGTSDVELTFEPEANGTRVTWTMTGKQKFVGKAMSLVMDCDKMIGPKFEEGLATLGAVASNR